MEGVACLRGHNAGEPAQARALHAFVRAVRCCRAGLPAADRRIHALPKRSLMRRLRFLLALGASSLLAGCQHTPIDAGPLIPDTVIADGVEYTAALQDRGDSLRVVVTLRNLQQNATEVVIGECLSSSRRTARLRG